MKLLAMKKRHHILGIFTLETPSVSEGNNILDNRIHKMLREEGLAKNEPKKQKRREWVRYQRIPSWDLSDFFYPLVFTVLVLAVRLIVFFSKDRNYKRAITKGSNKASSRKKAKNVIVRK
jgi:hypothetical protein